MSDPIIHPAPRPAPQDPEKPIAIWLKTLNSILSSSTAPSTSDISALFLPTSYWRDHLCLSWTYQTAPSPAAIESILSSQSIESITLSPTQKPPVLVVPVDFHGLVPAITAFVDVKTKHGNGVGLIRLLEDLDEGLGNWKAYTVFTALMGLDRFPEQSGANRPEGVTHGANPGRKNWKDLRALEQEFTESEPAVLIIGAGQGGLVAAARLKMLGIPTLVVDRNERVGDNWRKRYHQLGNTVCSLI